ncbi:hypothetical protein AMJ71_11225 [candidate division TA06 bacterium SM1_40]|uniref:Uncharacterized protein n=2 Tax=Bacteria division TA06 TaxID=1156500 RepID=A0A0S8JA97_UNCT6|nr:MAG: hypothetical protein AMJ82_11800 [candidate division TA06 bacterium SM23_40]KPL05749.1 MAG: hypothetical protein AMJ71_11225 [candidate division TA06 bacterium SM1_40]
MFVGNVAQKMASGSFCSIEMEEKAMDGKRVSLPVLGLVLALIFVSSQAIYGGQIWDDDEGHKIQDTPEGKHIPGAPDLRQGERVRIGRETPSEQVQRASGIDRRLPCLQRSGLRPSWADAGTKPNSRWAVATRHWSYLVWLMFRLSI